MPVPDFSPGEVLTAAAMDSIGMWKTASVSATSGSLVDVANCFSSDYDSYKIVISDFRANTVVGADVQLLLNGVPVTTGYYWMYVNGTYSTTSTYNQQGAANSNIFSSVAICAGASAGGGSFELYNPNLPTFTTMNMTRIDPRVAPTGSGGSGMGYLANSTQYNGVRILATGATITSLKVVVYGYRK
jgi:hypothetical protein